MLQKVRIQILDNPLGKSCLMQRNLTRPIKNNLLADELRKR